ncbi:DUF4192 family protein [Kocuria sp. M1R5S2]|uniref:DUF4192 family protein n=1 Tax=Kocuria rhizosphaerae TaxID=3376285 RepID=UPI00378B83A0
MRDHTAGDLFLPVVRRAADLLAVVPHTLGYWPADSLVLLGAGGGQAGACVRVDLPGEACDDPGAEAFAAELADLVRADEFSDRVFVVVYASEAVAGRDGLPPAAGHALALAEHAAERADREVAGSWVVAGDRWWAAGSPTGARHVAEILDSAVNAALVAGGSSYATAPRLAMDHEYGALPAGTERGVAAAAVRWARAGRGTWHRLERLAGALAVWDDVLRAVERAVDRWQPVVLALDDDLLGFLAAGLEDPVLADLLLAACATGDSDGVLAAAVLWAELCEEDLEEELGAVHGGRAPGTGAVPDGPSLAPAPPWLPPVPRRKGKGPRGRGTGAGRPALPEPDAERLALFFRVLDGKSEEAPCWARLDALYRVLLALSWLLEPAGGPPHGGGARPHAGVAAAVLVQLAQLNRFRARGSHTAHFVRRATALVPGHPTALRVLRLAEARPVPDWARRRSTAWHA